MRRFKHLLRGPGEDSKLINYDAGDITSTPGEGADMQVAAAPQGAGTDRVFGPGGTVHWGSANGPLVMRAVNYGEYNGGPGQKPMEHIPVPFAGGGVTWDQPVASANQKVAQAMAGPQGITPASVRGLGHFFAGQNAASAAINAPSPDRSTPPAPGASPEEILAWQKQMKDAFGPGAGMREGGGYAPGGNLSDAGGGS
jgi:hypothetical protein